MRVLLDTRVLSLPQGTGIATYGRNLSLINGELGNSVDLLYEFYRAGGQDPVLEEVSFYDPQYSIGSSRLDRGLTAARIVRQITQPNHVVRARPVARTGFVDDRAIRHRLPHFDRVVTAPLIYRMAWKYFSLTGRFLPVATDLKTDLAHWTAPFPIYAPESKNVYTIHDVIPLKLPFTSQDKRQQYLRLIRNIISIADHIVAVSETTKRDLVELVPDAEPKTSITYQSVQLPPKLLAMPADENARLVKNLFGVTAQKYFLFFSAIEPKKNVGRLLEAYLASNSPFPLIMVGHKGWLFEDELRPLGYQEIGARLLGRQGRVPARVIPVDFVNFRLLVALIRSARAVLFPSIYEGFGLPILEAMICGTPVMTSNFGAMKETAGAEAALLVDPFDPSDMTAAIERLSQDDTLCQQLAAAGPVRAKAFAWENYRERLAQAYRTALGGEIERSPQRQPVAQAAYKAWEI